MSVNDNLQQYYADRAQEYEKVYQIPERQGALADLRQFLQDTLAGHDVLEVACGTGFWTQPIATTALSIVATDVNPEVIALAKEKPYPEGKVRFQMADAFTLEGVEGDFTAGFAGFWWSHVPRSKLDGFLSSFHRKLGAGGLVVFVDNTPFGTRHAITSQDDEGNTYQRRRLESGKEYDVLKNLPTEAELQERLSGIAENIRYITLTYYWCLSYTIAGKDD